MFAILRKEPRGRDGVPVLHHGVAVQLVSLGRLELHASPLYLAF